MDHAIFEAETNPSDELIGRISVLSPQNPFSTAAYAQVRARLGADVNAFVIRKDEQITAGCLAFRTKGRLNTRLEITSLPQIPDPDIFWQGLFEHCRESAVTALSVNTFASTEVSLPEHPRPTSRQLRTEYVIDLRSDDLWAEMNRRSRRMVTRARDFGICLHRDSGPEARKAHVELANQSLDRLRERGEAVESTITRKEVDLYIDLDAGEIFQAYKEDKIYSTLLVATSNVGAYGQSSGTSDEGRDLGSSHFIFHETAVALKDETFNVLNLGGSLEQNKGLHDFKVGLGGRPVKLESADYFLGGPVKEILTKGLQLFGR